jgi:hypothetical protein
LEVPAAAVVVDRLDLQIGERWALLVVVLQQAGIPIL